MAALLEAGLPAVVAMQYKIWDEAAVAFSRSLYQALAVGLSLDEAVSAGRLAAFNLAHPSRDDANVGKFWRDWENVMVLGISDSAEQTFVLPAITDAREQKEVMDKLDNVFIKVKKIIAEVGGEDIVVKVGEMTDGVY